MHQPTGAYVDFERVGEDVQYFAIGAKCLPELTVDWGFLSKEERDVEHLGARFLCAAVLACFTNTFYNSLVREGATVKTIKARASTVKEKDTILRTRYTKVVLEMEVGLDEGDEDKYETVKEELEMGSLMTYSLPDGIEIEHDLRLV